MLAGSHRCGGLGEQGAGRGIGGAAGQVGERYVDAARKNRTGYHDKPTPASPGAGSVVALDELQAAWRGHVFCFCAQAGSGQNRVTALRVTK